MEVVAPKQAPAPKEVGASAQLVARDGLLPLKVYLEEHGGVRKGCAAAVVALMEYYTDVDVRLGILRAIEQTRNLPSVVRAGCVTRLLSWMEQCFGGGSHVS